MPFALWQVGEIAEAVELMAADSPVQKEKREIEELEREREASRETVEEGKKRSSTVSMLDSRVSAMLENLRAELAETESTIGQAFHSLDLDGDGARLGVTLTLTKSTLARTFLRAKAVARIPTLSTRVRPLPPPSPGAGVLSHDELLKAMEELHFSKRPDAAAFQARASCAASANRGGA